MRVSLRQILLFVTAASLLLGFGKFWMYVNSPAIPVEQLRKLNAAMTPQDVHAIIGEPCAMKFESVDTFEDYYRDERFEHPHKLGFTECSYMGDALVSVVVHSRYCPEELRVRHWCRDPTDPGPGPVDVDESWL